MRTFAQLLFGVSLLVWACSDAAPLGGLSNVAEGWGGFGGVGPFTSLGGSSGNDGLGGAGSGNAPDASAPDGGESAAARDDLYEVNALAPTTVPAPGLLANDTLAGAELLPATITTRLGGSVEVQADGSFVYTPPADPGALPRTDDFSYALSSEDGELSALVGLVLVSQPVANDDELGTLPDEALVLAAPGVLENDEPNGGRITAYDATSTEGGQVVLELTGALTYTPPAGFVGDDSFSYTLTDIVGSATAVVYVTVDEAPVAAEDHYLGSKGQALTPSTTLLANDSLGAPVAAVVSFGGGTLGGTVADNAADDVATVAGNSLTVGPSGSFVFSPDPDFVGPFEFYYRLQSSAGSSEARVVIDVHEAPLAVDDEYETLATSGALTVAATASNHLLSNDVGTPAPAITTFGGGSLGGTVADHAVGGDVEFSAGRLRVNADGSFSFEPSASASGEITFDYHIVNAAGNDEGTVRITVSRAPSITSEEELFLRAGTAQNLPFELTATGYPEPVISIEGVLPDGVTLEEGSLTGTASPDSAGEYEITLTAANGIEPDDVRSLFITVLTEAVITGAPTATFTVGTAGSYVPLLAGVPQPELSLDGDLPAGITFNPGTGALSGTPAGGAGGVYEVAISASNGLAADSILLVTIEVLEAPAITSAASVTFEVGEAGSFQVTSTGHPARTFSVSSNLPPGVTFDGATGTLSGTPAQGSGGTHELDVTAVNGVSPDATQELVLTVNEAPSLSGAATASFTVGQSGTYSVSSAGFPAPTLSLSESLPSGLSFDAQTGTLSGTPAAGTAGSYPLTFGASNGIGTAASLSVTLNIDEDAAITSASSTTFTVGSAGSFTVTATGTPAPTLSLSAGTLPAGVTFTPGTGSLAGTPDPGTGGTYSLTFTASNGVGADGSQSFVLTVNEAPALIGSSTTTFRVGTAGSYAVTATGFPAPTLGVTGTLPPGLSFAPLTGTISGTPEAGSGGSYGVSIGADNGVGIGASLSLTITVEESAEITSDDEVIFTVGTPDSFTVEATGTPAPTLALDEALPAGLTFTPETGVLEGTPAPGTGGEHTLTFSADNGIGSLEIQSFTLTINEAPGLTGAASATFVVGTNSSYNVVRTGFPVPSLSMTGSLPAGLSFDASTGTISGSAQSGTGGSYSVTITASNGIGSSASLPVTVNVQQAPAITSASSATFTVGSPGSFTVTGTGTPAPSFGVTGTLPSGVTLNTSTGVLSGTPASGSGNTYPLTLSASNGVGSAASQSFTLTVNEAPAISGAASVSFVVGSANTYTPTATGFPVPSFSLNGSLPSGLSFSTNTGVLSGTAASGSGGSYPVTITASNGIGNDDSVSVTINVTEAPAITSASSATFTVGSPGSFTVTGTGTPAPSFGVTGTLPSGVTLNTSTGVLSGTPASGSGGTYSLTLSASNGVGSAASQSFTLTVNEAPSISGTPPSPVDEDAAYSHTFTAGGFPAPTFSVVAGTLPPGLSLDTTTGVLSGTPTPSGTFSNITVRATNIAGTAEITFSIVVNVAVPAPIASGDAFDVTGNIPINVTLGVLNNDTSNGALVTGYGPSLASPGTTAPGGTLVTSLGGSVIMAAEGTFIYDPPAGFTGTDSFAYTLSNAGGSDTAQVDLTIGNMVWFVDSAGNPGGSGKATSPFTDLTGVTSTASGDVIYVRRGITYSSKTLAAGQRLLGQGVTVDATHLGFALAPFSLGDVFGAQGSNSTMGTLTLASGAYVRGMSLAPPGGLEGLVGTGALGVDISGMEVTTTSARAVNLDTIIGNVSLTSVTATGGSNGIAVSNNAGTFAVTGNGGSVSDNSGGSISSTSSDGILITNGQNITLRQMNLSNISASAVRGLGVNGLVMDRMVISNVGVGGDFDQPSSANLTGVVSITNSSFTTASGKLFALLNTSGTLSSLTFENNTFSGTSDYGSEFLIQDTASLLSGAIRGNTYTNTATSTSNFAALHVFVGKSTDALSTVTPFGRVDVENNFVSGTYGSGIRVRVQDCNGTLLARVLNNTVTNNISGGFSQGIRIESGSSVGGATLCAEISGNASVFTNIPGLPANNGGINLRRQSSGGTDDAFGIVGLPAGTAQCPQTGAFTCASTTAVTGFVNALNPLANGTLLSSSSTGFSSCTIP